MPPLRVLHVIPSLSPRDGGPTRAMGIIERALTTAGLLRRIEPPGSVARYEARVGDNHHHVVCRSCGAIADIDCAVDITPCLTASDDHGVQQQVDADQQDGNADGFFEAFEKDRAQQRD